MAAKTRGGTSGSPLGEFAMLTSDGQKVSPISVESIMGVLLSHFKIARILLEQNTQRKSGEKDDWVGARRHVFAAVECVSTTKL